MEGRRWKLLRVNSNVMLDLVLGWRLQKAIRLPVLENVPADCDVEGVHYDPATDMFLFRLAHESFEPVMPGELIPSASGAFHYQVIPLPQSEADEVKG